MMKSCVLSALLACGLAAPTTHVNSGVPVSPLTPAFGDAVQTHKGLRSLALEGFFEDRNQEGFADRIDQAVVAAPAAYTVPKVCDTTPVVAVSAAEPVEVKTVPAVTPVTYTGSQGYTVPPVGVPASTKLALQDTVAFPDVTVGLSQIEIHEAGTVLGSTVLVSTSRNAKDKIEIHEAGTVLGSTVQDSTGRNAKDNLCNTNASNVATLAATAAEGCRGTRVGTVHNPVPLAAEVYKKPGFYNPKRILGVSTPEVIYEFLGAPKGIKPQEGYTRAVSSLLLRGSTTAAPGASTRFPTWSQDHGHKEHKSEISRKEEERRLQL